MPLSTFLTFLAFLTRKRRWSRANQKTLPEIRREALGRRLAAEQTRSLLDGLVRAVRLRLMTTKTGNRAIHRWQVNPLLFFGAPTSERPERSEKGATLTTFLTFLTIVAPKPCFPAPVTSTQPGWSGCCGVARS